MEKQGRVANDREASGPPVSDLGSVSQGNKVTFGQRLHLTLHYITFSVRLSKALRRRLDLTNPPVHILYV